jgi:aryl-alcohol dehydrogenase-like predicted oxidoreductase
VIDSVRTGGVNVIDTAINYRYMKSERSVGAALQYLTKIDNYKRAELFVSSKIGYISEDFDNKISAEAYIEKLIKEKKISSDDVVGSCHCLHPNFLEDQLQKSLNNISLETLDLLYIHNSAESQMPLLGEKEYFRRLAKAFEFLEEKIQQNKIRSYGLATWVCFRAKPEEEKLHLSLEKIVELAEKVGGENHGLKYIQLPINIMMPEAFAEHWQTTSKGENKELQEVPLLTSARLNRINVFSSSPLLQGSIIQVPLPTDIFKCNYLGAKHLQFVRSIPAEALISNKIDKFIFLKF